jgi:hypothetical protein
MRFYLIVNIVLFVLFLFCFVNKVDVENKEHKVFNYCNGTG